MLLCSSPLCKTLVIGRSIGRGCHYHFTLCSVHSSTKMMPVQCSTVGRHHSLYCEPMEGWLPGIP